MAIWTWGFGKVAIKNRTTELDKIAEQTNDIVRPVESSFHTSCTAQEAHFYKVN
jgi:hypothetical protein